MEYYQSSLHPQTEPSLEEWVVTAMHSEKGYGADHSDLVTNDTPAFQLEVNANFGRAAWVCNIGAESIYYV